MNIDLTELIPRVHEAAKANGWWDTPRNAGEALMLCVSELSETLEADRNGKDKSGLSSYYRLLQEAELGGPAIWGTATSLEQRRQELFKWKVKDTVADELADAYIRLCDFAGGFGFPVSLLVSQVNVMRRNPFSWRENFGHNLLNITKWVVGLDGPNENRRRDDLGTILAALEALAAREGIDLATHIDLKLAYNSTRGTRHGGKAY